MKEYSKTCPLCKHKQVYSDEYHLKRAINTNALCVNCSRHLPSKKKQNLSGNVYGHLKVIVLDHIKNGHQYWKCKCDCGTETVVKHSHLTGHTVRTCGCSHLVLQDKHPHWKGYKEISGAYFSVVKRSAKKRNLPFDLTIEEMWSIFEKQNRRCALTGELLEFNKCLRSTNGTASLDRIDSSKGYTIGNVQWVHKFINTMKQDLTEKEFARYCQMVVDFRKDLL